MSSNQTQRNPDPNAPGNNQVAAASSQPDDSASARIREKIRQMIGSGQDLTDKKVRSEILNKLAKEETVEYTTASQAYNKVIREGKPNLGAKTTQRTVGDIHLEVTTKPKDKQQKGSKDDGDQSNQEQKKKEEEALVELDGKKYRQVKLPNGQIALEQVKGGVKLSHALEVKFFKGMHRDATNFLYRAIEAAWGVKVERPTEKEFDDNAELWATVCDEYGIALPQVMVLGARNEVRKKKEADAERSASRVRELKAQAEAVSGVNQ